MRSSSHRSASPWLEGVPYEIPFLRIGDPAIGHLNILECNKLLPFKVQRVFWTTDTPESVERGGHAHRETQMVIVALQGTIQLSTETLDHKKASYLLDTPNKGVFIPPFCWHSMRYSPGTVQLVLASSKFDEFDYIRDRNLFDRLKP